MQQQPVMMQPGMQPGMGMGMGGMGMQPGMGMMPQQQFVVSHIHVQVMLGVDSAEGGITIKR